MSKLGSVFIIVGFVVGVFCLWTYSSDVSSGYSGGGREHWTWWPILGSLVITISGFAMKWVSRSEGK